MLQNHNHKYNKLIKSHHIILKLSLLYSISIWEKVFSSWNTSWLRLAFTERDCATL